MRNDELQDRLRIIDGLLTEMPDDLPLREHWGRYMCITIAGFLEKALHTVYSVYVNRKSNDNVARFAIRQIERIRNPNADRFIETARAFNETWGEDLSTFIYREEQARKEAVDAIMRNRNRIAHGESSVISPAQAKAYLDKCVEVIDFEDQCLGRP